jgi:hypothetical protein
MRTSNKRVGFFGASVAGLCALALCSAEAWATPSCANGNRVARNGSVKRLAIVGLTSDGRLVCFTDRAPQKAVEIGTIGGLGSTDGAFVGIDFRVQDGKLYGVGDGGGVYTIDLTTAQATKVSQLSETLRGVRFGVDFNPVADRLRIVSDDGQNLRHNVNAGGTTTADPDLNYMTGVSTKGVGGAAYVNNDLDASTGTTLFDLDASTLQQIALQSPPNNGSLVAAGKLTVPVDVASDVGFDVFSAPANGVTVGNRGYASLVVNGVPGFYWINLLTGKATLVGSFVAPVVDIAIPLARP